LIIRPPIGVSGGDSVSFAAALILVAAQMAAGAAPPAGLPLAGEEAEAFLRTAEVVTLEEVDSQGITMPRKATLRDGERSHDAIFKTINSVHLREKLPRGKTLLRLKDSYKHEIAAYELDKLLGLGFIPPTVERKIDHETGSLGFWVHGAMTEWQRSKIKHIDPPDAAAFNNQRQSIQLFLQLIWDADYNNTSNILIDGNWKLYKIDASRAFYTDSKLRKPSELLRFPRGVLNRLEALTKPQLDSAMEPWLDKNQRESLWKRRTAILELAGKRVSENGEAATLFP